MTKARNLSDLLDANGDVKSTALDNVPPSNDASALTTGTIDNARISLDANEIPNLDTAKITTGTFNDARIPSLDTSKITSGTFSDARMPSTVLNSNVDLTNLSASSLTSGTIPDARFPATLPAVSGANLTGISSGGIVASSYSSAGYAKFSDGLIIQWGSGNSNAGIGFPITFPNACRQVTAVVEGTSFWDTENIQVGSFSTSSFTTKMQSKNRNTSWIAVGH